MYSKKKGLSVSKIKISIVVGGFLVGCLLFSNQNIQAQNKTKWGKVEFRHDKAAHKVDILIGNKPFSSFLYTDKLEKPILYPLITSDGKTVTRGFPLEKRKGERIDHPHHVGLWLNYESVNGLDFWNNSYAIPADRKSKYGWIRNVKVTGTAGGKDKGTLAYIANWENQKGTVLLEEKTNFVIRGNETVRTIDRYTTLKAAQDTVYFKDIKDGMLGLRVITELEIPADKAEDFTAADSKTVKASSRQMGAVGNYLSAKGLTGNEVWGTRGNWCVMSAAIEGKDVSIGIVDHPSNPGYPTYWHARDYGLFAANPLGQSVFSNGAEKLNLKLSPGEAVTFRYRVVVASGQIMDKAAMDAEAADFGAGTPH